MMQKIEAENLKMMKNYGDLKLQLEELRFVWKR